MQQATVTTAARAQLLKAARSAAERRTRIYRGPFEETLCEYTLKSGFRIRIKFIRSIVTTKLFVKTFQSQSHQPLVN